MREWLPEIIDEVDHWIEKSDFSVKQAERIRQGLILTQNSSCYGLSEDHRPTLFIPNLSATPWWDPSDFQWSESLIQAKQQILAELKKNKDLKGGRISEHSADTSCLLYTSPSPRDKRQSRMPSSA